MDFIGRKKSLIGANFFSLIGWIVIASAPSITVICVGRFLNGMAAATIALAGKQIFERKKERKNFFFEQHCHHVYSNHISMQIL
jgi:hypothetical protein